MRNHVTRTNTTQVISDIAQRSASTSKRRAITRKLGEERNLAETPGEVAPDSPGAFTALRRGSGSVARHEAGARAQVGVRGGVGAGVGVWDGEFGGDALAAVVLGERRRGLRRRYRRQEQQCRHC